MTKGPIAPFREVPGNYPQPPPVLLKKAFIGCRQGSNSSIICHCLSRAAQRWTALHWAGPVMIWNKQGYRSAPGCTGFQGQQLQDPHRQCHIISQLMVPPSRANYSDRVAGLPDARVAGFTLTAILTCTASISYPTPQDLMSSGGVYRDDGVHHPVCPGFQFAVTPHDHAFNLPRRCPR